MLGAGLQCRAFLICTMNSGFIFLEFIQHRKHVKTPHYMTLSLARYHAESDICHHTSVSVSTFLQLRTPYQCDNGRPPGLGYGDYCRAALCESGPIVHRQRSFAVADFVGAVGAAASLTNMLGRCLSYSC